MLKHVFYIFIWILAHAGISQVNLVINPSFESYTVCPNFGNGISDAVSWKPISLSPDYYNSCANGSGFGVPSNSWGHQSAANGTAYAGIFTFQISGPSPWNFREVIGGQLSNTLVPGTTYSFSMKVNLVIDENNIFNRATNKIGVKFSTVDLSLATSSLVINNFAHIYSNNVISDTLNWTTVSGSFTADSFYKYINIGNFFDDANTLVQYFQDTLSNNQAAYYFVDDIVLTDESVGFFENNESQQWLQICPSIFTDFTTIKANVSRHKGECKMTIYSGTGAKVSCSNFAFDNGTYILKRNTLPDGIYFVEFRFDNLVYLNKIIIN